MSLTQDIFSEIAVSLPFEERGTFNLSTAEWLRTLTADQKKILTDLRIKPQSLLFRRLADFINVLNQVIINHDNYLFIGKDIINKPLENLDTYIFSPNVQVKVPEIFDIVISRIINGKYQLFFTNFDEPEFEFPFYVSAEDFPFTLLSMIVLWELKVDEELPDQTLNQQIHSYFDQLVKTVRSLRY